MSGSLQGHDSIRFFTEGSCDLSYRPRRGSMLVSLSAPLVFPKHYSVLYVVSIRLKISQVAPLASRPLCYVVNGSVHACIIAPY